MNPTSALAPAPGQPIRLVTPDGAALIDPVSGEAIAIADQNDARLAAAAAALDDLAAAARDAKEAVGAELLKRLDRGASWTRRVGDPRTGVQYEVKAPSPQAGTEEVDALLLERELRSLHADGLVDLDGAGRALERTVTVTARIVIDCDLDWAQTEAEAAIRDRLGRYGVLFDAPTSTSARRAIKAGCGAIAKASPAGKDAIVDAIRRVAPPPRKVTVKPVANGGR